MLPLARVAVPRAAGGARAPHPRWRGAAAPRAPQEPDWHGLSIKPALCSPNPATPLCGGREKEGICPDSSLFFFFFNIKKTNSHSNRWSCSPILEVAGESLGQEKARQG